MAKSKFKLSSLLLGRCPSCHQGQVLEGWFTIRKRCPSCNYDLHPEPGFYVGAMAVGFLFTAAVTIPPTIALKVMGADVLVLVFFPLVEFLFVGTFLIFYCRLLWLHLEYRMTNRLDGTAPEEARKTESV